jgi:hypothetical protein
MLQRDGIAGTPRLNFEAWRALLRSNCGGEVQVTTPKVFAGWMRPLNAFGLAAAAVKIQWDSTQGGLGRHVHRLERTYRDVRLDGSDHYLILFQVAGQSAMTQIDRAAQLTVGDVALIDAARPVTFLSQGSTQWLSLRLPRKLVRSHLGFEPQACLRSHGTRTARLLFDFIRDAETESAFSFGESYMQMAVYDLVGATICAIRSPAHLTLNGQTVRAHLQPDQGRMLRSGFRAWRNSCCCGDLVTVRSEALHRSRHHLQRIHLFSSPGSRCPSTATSRLIGLGPASWRDRLRMRLSRLCAFCAKISPSIRLSAGGARRAWSKRRHRNSARWYRRECVVGTRRSISGVLNTTCDRNLVRAIGPE